MEQERRSMRIGLAVIAVALTLRLLSSGVLTPVMSFLRSPEVTSFVLFLETGRKVNPGMTVSAAQPETEPTQPVQTTTPVTQGKEESPAAVFEKEDAQLVQLSSLSGYAVDVEAMLLTPLQWELVNPQPTVLILHSHATESYTPTAAEPYRQSAAYRTLDAQHNMLRVGDWLQQLLEAEGIGVIHDRTLHDYPDYNSAYTASRAAAQQYLEQYPSIRMVLDLHRDAAEVSGSGQLNTHAQVGRQDSAQLMLVIGTDSNGLSHPNWRENMALAVKLHAALEKQNPGICRPINFRSQRFNQDLSTGALLVEVGAAGDTLEEALVAAEALAQGILALSGGAVTADSTS